MRRRALLASDNGANCLCFTATQANSSVSLTCSGTPTQGQSFEYSIDETAWQSYTIGTVITLTSVDDKVYFRGENTTVSESATVVFKFVMNGKIAASGDVTSLLNNIGGNVQIPSYCYTFLFARCSQLETAPNLPSSIVGQYGYAYMFSHCSGLHTAPALPALTLGKQAYFEMFTNCTALTSIPALPAVSLTDGCYTAMFGSCSSLQVYSSSGTGHTHAWRIPATGTATGETAQSAVFYGTTGDYSTVSGNVNLNTTFYTQNTPIT